MRFDSSSIRRIAISVDLLVRGGPHAEQLGVAADGGERGAQLVGGVGEETAQALFAGCALGKRLLETVEHRVQRQAEPPDLRLVGGRADASGELARGDLTRGYLHAVKRTQPEPHDKGGADGQRQQDADDHQRLDEQQTAERLFDFAAAARRRR